MNRQVRGLLRRDPAGFLAWVNARWGILGPRLLGDLKSASRFWADKIGGDPRRNPEYHWHRMYGCALGELGTIVAGFGWATLVGLLSLSTSLLAFPFVPIVGFVLLICWHGMLHWLAQGRADRLPLGLVQSSWASMVTGMLLATGLVALVYSIH